MTDLRHVVRTLTAHRQSEGGGFMVRRPFPSQEIVQIDPFLLLDEMGPAEYGPGEALGAPDHPHRGFETVTYMLEGEMEHKDSAGHRGKIGPGDVQWMTAGRGVVHSEMPSKRILEKGGRMHGFQIWVNLPAKDKMMAPRYQEFPKEKLPTAKTPDGLAHVRVIAGEALGARAVIETRTPIMLQDWTLEPGASVDIPIPESIDVSVFVWGGGATISGKGVRDGDFAVLSSGSIARLARAKDAKSTGRLLLLGGAPIREPIVRNGPFVMNTEVEIKQAFVDYRTGNLGKIAR
jgi:redox-sensitive bicupin YhaK (pirin superfamily)